MRPLLIPIELDTLSENTMAYAAEWSKAYGYDHIILLKTLYGSIFDTLIASAGYMQVPQDYLSNEREEAINRLNEIRDELQIKTGTGIQVSVTVSELPLLRAILETIRDEAPELLVIGSDNFNYQSKGPIAQHVISIAKISPVKVLIVPAGYQYEPIREILVPCDFNTIETLSKLESYYTPATKLEDKKLWILNIDAKEAYLHPSEELKEKEQLLHQYLKGFPHKIYYANDKDVIKGITAFARENAVGLIVSLPGSHSFFYLLTHKSISQAIYNNANRPVLILK